MLAWILRSTIASLLYGVDPADSATFLIAAIGLFAAATAATFWPAYLATRLDPLTCLRSD